MSSQPIYSGCFEEELLEALLTPDDRTYPWNPAEAEAEGYLAELERGFSDSWSDEEVSLGAKRLFAQFDDCWAKSSSTVVPSVVRELQAKLSQQFATRIPLDWLENIAQQAYQVVSDKLSATEQLVHCVQELLPNWYQDDLEVLARPYALAMRSHRGMRGTETSAIDPMLETVRSADWTELSEVEQVRLSMAIARYALTQLKESNP